MYEKLKNIFEEANMSFLKEERSLFDIKVSERTLCGALMLHLTEKIKGTDFKEYKVDVEYNRNKGGKLKTIKNSDYKVININCDLILHSRGEYIEQDNLIAIEMKKSTGRIGDKIKDKERLEALTKNSFDDIWSFDGKSFPEHVCRYVIGVYYEINYRKSTILIEYYRGGYCIDRYSFKYTDI